MGSSRRSGELHGRRPAEEQPLRGMRAVEPILREIAALSDQEIDVLVDEGVIGSTPIGVPALPR